ncbi:rCG22367 [Rattus norvegicus]|uniref:RCG22367 n=1 Tax=Rattus norvegicus TaxID=10116 RepID=A6INS8_RAT|nr:rCG22367 [Rattus norvegicus]
MHRKQKDEQCLFFTKNGVFQYIYLKLFLSNHNHLYSGAK